MRHLKKGRKFSRTRDQRNALLATLGYHLIMRERIETSEAKAKELRPLVEKMISQAKRGTLPQRRMLAAHLPREATQKLMATIASRFKNRRGGYTRLIKLAPRRSDASRQAVIEFVNET